MCDFSVPGSSRCSTTKSAPDGRRLNRRPPAKPALKELAYRVICGYLFTGGTTAARPGLVEVIGRVARSAAAHCRFGCGSHLACALPVAAAGSGSRGVWPARSSVALLAERTRFEREG